MPVIWTNTSPEPSSPAQQEQIYNGLDCCVTLEVFHQIRPQLDELTSLTYSSAMELQAPILEMMLRGVRIDHSEVENVKALYSRQHDQLQSALDDILVNGLGIRAINPGSWQDKQWLLYDILKLPPVRKRGRVTTDRGALEKLSSYFQAEPICTHIMALQDIRKKLGFLKTGLGDDGRIRTSFSIAGTDTGRLSSSSSAFWDGTNLQNIAPEMRKIFISDEGMKFAYIDLEQAEARMVGAIIWNLFGDPKYLDFCESGDLHTNVTKGTWKTLPWTGDPNADKNLAKQPFYRDFSYRDAAKRLGHASNYHGQPPQISREVRIPLGLVQEFQREYFAQFSGIPRWHNHVRTKLIKDGWITSAAGRRRWFFGRRWENETLNAAIAYDPQSSIADYINRGLLAVWKRQLPGLSVLLQIHDALLIQYPEHLEGEIVPEVQRLLEIEFPLMNGRTLKIPTEAMVGWNWGYAYNDKKELVNPNGLVSFGADERKRQAKTSVLDRKFY